MKIGILQAGRTPDELREIHGDYDDLYKRFLSGRGFEFDTYPVLDGIFPENPEDAEGWLITGSRFGAYDDHAWIEPLENFLRRVYQIGVPIVGVCFGHQILAQALGGKVEKYPGGWSVGAVDYEVDANSKTQTVMAWHQDQVTQIPDGATVIGRTDFCKHAMLVYGNRALTVQPHPEFTPDFMADLIEARRDVLPADVARNALTTLATDLTSSKVADQFEAFFKNNRKNGHMALKDENERA